MARIGLVIFGGSVLLLAASTYAQSDDHSKGGVEQCREIADAEARLACYDRIGRSDPVGREELESEPDAAAESDPSIAGSETEDSEYDTLTDDTGLPKAADSNKPIPVTVSKCGEATNFKFYFYLDNGQVWRYIGGEKLRLRGCEGTAFLVEDRFGFTLQMDGDSARLRVKRVK
jgi:hypothetical protein